MKNLDCFSKKRIYKWWLFRIYVKVYRKVSMKKMRSSSARQLIMRNPCTVNRGFVYLEIMELWLVDFQPRFIPRGYMFISQNWNSMCRNMGFVPTNHGDRQEHIWACLYAVFGAGTKKKSTRKPNGSSLSGFSVENCHTWDTDTPFHHEFTAVFSWDPWDWLSRLIPRQVSMTWTKLNPWSDPRSRAIPQVCC